MLFKRNTTIIRKKITGTTFFFGVYYNHTKQQSHVLRIFSIFIRNKKENIRKKNKSHIISMTWVDWFLPLRYDLTIHQVQTGLCILKLVNTKKKEILGPSMMSRNAHLQNNKVEWSDRHDWSLEPILSLSLTLLFKGNSDFPGFHIVSQEELLGELLHVGGNVQVFALHVRDECFLEAERHKSSLSLAAMLSKLADAPFALF